MRRTGRKRWEREVDSKRSPNRRYSKPTPEPKPRDDRDETTRYQSDPLRGNKRAHAIARKLRDNHSPRQIAKHLNISLDEVRRIQRLLK